jgi:bla regulator protein blaR1
MMNAFVSHIWQSTLFAGMAALLTLAFRPTRAQVRYWIWLSASLKFVIPFALFTTLGSHIHIWAPSAVREIARDPAVSYTVTHFSGPAFPQVSESMALSPRSAPSMQWLIASIWGCGVICLALIRLREWWRVRRIIRDSLSIDLPLPVEVRSSRGLSEPAVVGLIRPVLLLPQGINERLTPSEMNAILAHELCHVRRRDNLLVFPHMIVEMVFWFHPLVWWIGARLMEERERACDEDVVRGGADPNVYAEAILTVCKLYVGSPRVCVCGATGATLKRRIEMIMESHVAQKLGRGRKILLASTLAVIVAVPLFIGIIRGGVSQASAAPFAEPTSSSFEVASVKPSTEPATDFSTFCLDTCTFGERLSVSGTNVSIRYMSLFNLILTAWRITPNQLSAPEWMKSQRFDITAKTPAGASKQQIPEMLQSLLRERFRLAIHRDRKDQPVFALVVGRHGSKLQDATAGASPSDVPTIDQVYTHYAEARHSDSGDTVIENGFYGPMRFGRGGNGGMQWEFQRLTMPGLAALLTPHLDRPVVDRTNLTGSYHLVFQNAASSPERSRSTKTGEPSDAAPGGRSDAYGEGLIQAIERAGLKLESSKAPVEIVIVDRAEKSPTPN